MKYNVFLLIVCVLMSASCTSNQNEKDESLGSWPEYLRMWADLSEITDQRRLDILDQIDTLYHLVEDSVADDNFCEKACQLKATMSDVIQHDTSLVFPLMMRATLRNLSGKFINNPWFLKTLVEVCECNADDYMSLNHYWSTHHDDNHDFMYYTFMGLSWNAPNLFANLVIEKSDSNDILESSITIYSFFDSVINDIQIFIIKEDGSIDILLDEYMHIVPDSCLGVVHVFIPPQIVLSVSLCKGGLGISYTSNTDTIEMKDLFLEEFFLEQIEECPRIKAEVEKIRQQVVEKS